MTVKRKVLLCTIAQYWNINSRQLFTGEVLSVAPWMMKAIPKLLCLNERMVLAGKWRYGTMVMVPVGATNVRSIKVEKANNMQKGDLVGMFELGSCVVLLATAPKGKLNWSCKPGDRVMYGQSLVLAHEGYSWLSWLGF